MTGPQDVLYKDLTFFGGAVLTVSPQLLGDGNRMGVKGHSQQDNSLKLAWST